MVIPEAVQAWGRKLAPFALVAGVAFAAGRYSHPQRVEQRAEAKVETVQEAKKDTQTDLQTLGGKAEKGVRRTTFKPDGTVVVLEGWKKSEVDASTLRQGVVEALRTEARTETKTEVITEYARDDWMVGASAGYSWADVAGGRLGSPVYGLEVRRRILGPFWLGVAGDSERSVRGTVSVSF